MREKERDVTVTPNENRSCLGSKKPILTSLPEIGIASWNCLEQKLAIAFLFIIFVVGWDRIKDIIHTQLDPEQLDASIEIKDFMVCTIKLKNIYFIDWEAHQSVVRKSTSHLQCKYRNENLFVSRVNSFLLLISQVVLHIASNHLLNRILKAKEGISRDLVDLKGNKCRLSSQSRKINQRSS